MLTLKISEVKHEFFSGGGGGRQAENVYIIGGFVTKFYVVLRGAHLCKRFSSYFRFCNSYCKIVLTVHTCFCVVQETLTELYVRLKSGRSLRQY